MKENSGKGKLIVIEGLDGSGKATQASLLFEELQNIGYDSKKVSFPDYEQPSSSLVKMYLNSELGKKPEDVNAYAASSFYAVDRFASYVNVWKEWYESGNIVVADRYTTSNAIYHMGKLPSNEWDYYLSWLNDFEYNKLGLPNPDLVIYLSMPVDVSQRLLAKRYDGNLEKKDIHEKNIQFLKTCSKSAEYSIKKLGWKQIFCSDGEKVRTVEEIHKDVLLVSMEAIQC